MNNKDTFDKILDSLLDEALPIVESMPDKNLPEETEAPFTEEDERRSLAILAKERAALRAVRARTYLKRVAVCAAVFMLLCAILVMSVSALRAPVLNFITKPANRSTQIQLNRSDNTDEVSVEAVYEEEGLYIGYIPEGFSLEQRTIAPASKSAFLQFKNGSEYFNIDTSIYQENTDITIDTENAKVERMRINDKPALYSEKETIKILFMYDENYTYTIAGNIDKDNLVQIAQNLKKY